MTGAYGCSAPASAAGQCLAECKEWEMCLTVLGDDESGGSTAHGPMDTDDSSQVPPASLSILTAQP